MTSRIIFSQQHDRGVSNFTHWVMIFLWFSVLMVSSIQSIPWFSKNVITSDELYILQNHSHTTKFSKLCLIMETFYKHSKKNLNEDKSDLLAWNGHCFSLWFTSDSGLAFKNFFYWFIKVYFPQIMVKVSRLDSLGNLYSHIGTYAWCNTLLSVSWDA